MNKHKSISFIPKVDTSIAEGLHNEIIHQPITDTLELNYMPYAMSVIVSRAIPEIDGFKPSHRKLLYTMYKMGLLTGSRTKSANIVGQTMRLNPHGDSAIYETMVRLSKGNESLLTPFVDSKGNFGKVYSRDMAYAASRYTEAKLSEISSAIFQDIDSDVVDFVDNYDGTMKEPTLLPTMFPNILVSSNTGIAVGMASQICGFNLNEVCQTTIELIKNEDHDVATTLLAPDFTTGGEFIYNEDEIRNIYETGRGSFKLRAKWRYIKDQNVVEVYEIPYSTTAEAIVDKVADLLKTGKIREISDMRDETDLGGLKLAIDLKRGVDPEKLMDKLFKLTPLMDSYSCNFNILIHGVPKVLGVKGILNEWITWRQECIHRRLNHDLGKKQDKLHLLEGLKKILLDIDKTISIIRNTRKESRVVPNLMTGFDIDQVQAEYVADMKLRNINKEYIIKQLFGYDKLNEEIIELGKILDDATKIRDIIIQELEQIINKYPSPRRTSIIHFSNAVEVPEDEHIEDYNVNLFLTKEGYFKKISAQSLGASSEQRYKDGDSLLKSLSATNKDEVLLFTNKQQVYILRLNDVESTKASSLGVYLSSLLDMDPDEQTIDIIIPGDYSDNLLFFFENGKAVKIALSNYVTKGKRRKLTGAYSDASKLESILVIGEDEDLLITTTDGRALVVNSSKINLKSSRTSQGAQVITFKKDAKLKSVQLASLVMKNKGKYRSKSLPSVGYVLHTEDLISETKE